MPLPARHRIGRRTVTTAPGGGGGGGSTGTDLSGNPIKPGVGTSTPTATTTTETRRAIAIYQRGTDAPVSADFLDRHINDLTVLVPDRGWRNGDVMMIGGAPDPADKTKYLGGTAFQVDGDPADWPGGAPVQLPNGVGISVNVKRVAGGAGVL